MAWRSAPPSPDSDFVALHAWPGAELSSSKEAVGCSSASGCGLSGQVRVAVETISVLSRGMMALQEPLRLGKRWNERASAIELLREALCRTIAAFFELESDCFCGALGTFMALLAVAAHRR